MHRSPLATISCKPKKAKKTLRTGNGIGKMQLQAAQRERTAYLCGCNRHDLELRVWHGRHDDWDTKGRQSQNHKKDCKRFLETIGGIGLDAFSHDGNPNDNEIGQNSVRDEGGDECYQNQHRRRAQVVLNTQIDQPKKEGYTKRLKKFKN